ncbi:MAG TPA: hypothetical protein VFC65_01205 [Prolixibacteraceae bacterium]|nr:hypothetical protein [Prolixibacteraceae bacterium]
MQKDKLEMLASERSNPCITVSMNTPQKFPNNQQDVIELKKLFREAYEHVAKEFGQYPVSGLLEKIDNLEEKKILNYNLESIHIFISDSTTEIVKSSWPTLRNVVSVAENFVIKPLIKEFNRLEEYLILVLSQSEVRLLHAINDSIAKEIKDEEFPFAESTYLEIDQDKSSDAKQADNKIRDYFNQIDKALVKIQNKTGMNIVVVCTEDNWSSLMQVADKPSIYYGNFSMINNDTTRHSIASDAWQIVNAIQEKGRTRAIQEMKEANGHGKVLTDLSAILQAAIEGRGDLLIVHDDYHQAVKMTGEYSFDLVTDVTKPEVIDDITSDMAWEVLSKKGRAIFTNQEEFKSLGNIALKVRY